MSSDRIRKKRYNSAKKARQGKNWIFPVVLLFCVLMGLAGAALNHYLYAPLKYSDREIDEYVKNIYGDSWTLLRKKETPGESGGINAYLYENKEEGTFSVFSMSVPVEKDGVSSGRNRKVLCDNYFSTVIENRLDRIRDLAKKTEHKDGPEFEIEVTGEPSGAFGAQYIFRLYLESSRQIEAAGELLSEIDGLLGFSAKKGSEPWNLLRADTPFVHVYLKPDHGITGGADAVTGAAKKASDPEAAGPLEVPGDWRSPELRDGYEIGRISFTDLASPSRYTPESLARRMENDYVDAARTFGSGHYTVSEELAAKYPAPVLTLINVGGHNLTEKGENKYTYQFVYCRSKGTYWMLGLDPCEDFDGSPYGDYPRRGAFSNLVRCLGGTFSAEDWTGNWRIGTTQWEAVLQTQERAGIPYSYKRFRLTCNGNETLLDTVPEVFAGTGAVPSGRPFSIRDLIRMLDVRITINQKDMTAVMFRDFEDE